MKPLSIAETQAIGNNKIVATLRIIDRATGDCLLHKYTVVPTNGINDTVDLGHGVHILFNKYYYSQNSKVSSE